MSSSKIGFIGLGIMGKGMANRMATELGSSQLVVWNRSGSVAAEFASQYKTGKVEAVSTPAEVIKACDVTYSMLSTLDASKAVFEGREDGVLGAITPGKVIIDCSTLTPERMVQQEAMVQQRGGRFMDAPVSGSKGHAESGTLVFLCSGEKKVYDEVQAPLKAMGKANFFLGEAGQGPKFKLLVNMLMATNMNTFAEVLALCEAAALPGSELLKVLDLTAIGCPMYKGKGSSMLGRDYSTAFPLKHAQKDVRYALSMAESLGVDIPTTKVGNEQYLKAIDQGLADEDFSAVFEVIQKNNDKK